MDITKDCFWAIDVEGNGGSPPQIVELALVEVVGLALTGNQRHWLVRPDGPIKPAASRIHGLTDADLRSAPSIEDIADDVLPLIEERPIVGHNVRVEVDILKRSLPDWVPDVAIDTLRLARLAMPGRESYALASLGAYFGLEQEAARRSGLNHHSALFDAVLAAMLFTELLSLTPDGDRRRALEIADILRPRQASLL